MAAIVKEIQAADWQREALAPRPEAAAAELTGRARFVKVFRQGNRELATELGVLGSPTLLFFRGGVEAAPRHTGGQIGRSVIVKAVEGLLE